MCVGDSDLWRFGHFLTAWENADMSDSKISPKVTYIHYINTNLFFGFHNNLRTIFKL